MRVRFIAVAVLCVFPFLTSAQAQTDITVLQEKVLFNNKNGDEQPALMRVNFRNGGTRFTVCLRPNGPIETACPVFKQPSPQCFSVVNPAPHRFSLILKSNNTVTRSLQRCALTYSIVPQGQPPNYFGNPEIGVAYGLR